MKDAELHLRRKWTFRAHGEQMVFYKKRNESTAHVLMKAMLWALALPECFRVQVEPAREERYRPDVLGRDVRDEIVFWGEAGHTDPRKMGWIARRHPRTRLVFARWNDSMKLYLPLVRRAMGDIDRPGSTEIWNFPEHSPERFFQDNEIRLNETDIEIVKL